MSAQILHLVIDDKFIDMAIREFDLCAPQRNRYLSLRTDKPKKYIRSNRIEFLSPDEILQLINDDSRCAAVVFHTIDSNELTLISKIKKGRNIAWIGWGYDYYDRLLSQAFPAGLTGPQTSALMQNSPGAKSQKTQRSLLRTLAARLIKGPHPEYKVLRKISTFSPVIEDEFHLARKLNPWFRPEYCAWNYGSAEEDFGANNPISSEAKGKDIIVGNSASPNNNHLEAFAHIATYDTGASSRIIVPLSYGNPWYRDEIIKAGESMFGERFTPLTEFMAKEAYNTLLENCSQVFMNHYRQQALGNLCILMLKGASIHLNSKNPLYSWFCRQGAEIFKIDASNSNHRRNAPLPTVSHGAAARHREIILSNFGQTSQRNKTIKFCEHLLGDKPDHH